MQQAERAKKIQIPRTWGDDLVTLESRIARSVRRGRKPVKANAKKTEKPPTTMLMMLRPKKAMVTQIIPGYRKN